MTGLGTLLGALLIGLLSGAIFFGGLLWTVRAGMAARNPALWFPISLVLRATLIIVGFYYVAAGGWQAVLLCMGGVLIARTAMLQLTRVARDAPHAT
jgi:F1F0 ATPase subunit 2